MNELTEDIYKGAQANKEQQTRKRTTAQLPVFRECSNLPPSREVLYDTVAGRDVETDTEGQIAILH